MTEEEVIYLPKDNSEIEKYLNYYMKLINPGYAVFLNGPWGAGKTWFIREFKRKHGEDKFVHVSLYGISSTEQINDQIFHQLYPKLNSGKVKIAAKGVKAVAGVLGYSLDHIDLKEYLKLQTDKVFIFDDLERCDSPNLALGFINRYIEHNGNRVILIGEEEFLKSKDETFKNQKEKTIGRNFTIYPEFKATFDYLIGIESHSSIKDLLQKHYTLIETCFKRADCRNLRTLKFCITEFYRFYEQLPEKAKKHDDFLHETVNTFFSLCVEFRSGGLEVDDIPSIQDAFSLKVAKSLGGSEKDSEPDPLSVLRSKHFGEGLNTIEPSLKMLYCFFKFGSVHPQMMNDSIDNCSYFIEKNTAPWIKLWHSHSITDAEFESCYAEVIQNYRALKYTKIGELRHIAGILLNYSHERLIELSYDEVVALNEAVVKEMIEKKLIEPENESEEFRAFDDISHGMQFQALRDSNFQSISQLIKQGAHKKKEDKHEAIAASIPALIKEDARKFWSLVSSGRDEGEEARLYKYPVMKYVDVDEFVSALVDMNPINAARFTVFHALKDRYQHVYSYPALKEDLPWLIELQVKMVAKISDLKQPTKNHFSAMLVNLGNIIEGINKATTTAETAI